MCLDEVDHTSLTGSQVSTLADGEADVAHDGVVCVSVDQEVLALLGACLDPADLQMFPSLTGIAGLGERVEHVLVGDHSITSPVSGS